MHARLLGYLRVQSRPTALKAGRDTCLVPLAALTDTGRRFRTYATALRVIEAVDLTLSPS